MLFNDDDLISWANRKKAKIGDIGFFADSVSEMEKTVRSGFVRTIDIIDNDSVHFCFGYYQDGLVIQSALFLPLDKVKIKIKQRKFRPLRNLNELCSLLNITIANDNNCKNMINMLIGKKVHIRCCGSRELESFCLITGIYVDVADDTLVLSINNMNLKIQDLLHTYEIEVNENWIPFGMIDNED